MMSNKTKTHFRRIAQALKYTPILFSVMLLLAAIAHRRMLDSPDYVTSPLVMVEVVLAVLLIVSIPIKVITGVYFVVKQQWKSMLVAVLTAFFCVISLLVAMVIDAATLVFGT